MKYSIYYFTFLISLLIVACGPSEEDKARVRLNYAKKLLEINDTTRAVLQLDSIVLLFPKATFSVNAAKNMKYDINFDLLKKKEAELDSAKAQISVLETSFSREKTEYDRYTQYIHKKQTVQGSLTRSFLQVHLDERGEIFLSSNYYGKSAINHVALRVYDGDVSASTDTVPIGDPNNHQSDFMEYKWEKVSYRDGKDNGVIELIANNTDRKLKAVFLGKSQFYIILEDYDKAAVKDALTLSKAIKERNSLEKQVKDLQNQLQIQ